MKPAFDMICGEQMGVDLVSKLFRKSKERKSAIAELSVAGS